MDGQVTLEQELMAAATAAAERLEKLELENVLLRRELAKKKTSRWRR